MLRRSSWVRARDRLGLLLGRDVQVDLDGVGAFQGAARRSGGDLQEGPGRSSPRPLPNELPHGRAAPEHLAHRAAGAFQRPRAPARPDRGDPRRARGAPGGGLSGMVLVQPDHLEGLVEEHDAHVDGREDLVQKPPFLPGAGSARLGGSQLGRGPRPPSPRWPSGSTPGGGTCPPGRIGERGLDESSFSPAGTRRRRWMRRRSPSGHGPRHVRQPDALRDPAPRQVPVEVEQEAVEPGTQKCSQGRGCGSPRAAHLASGMRR